MNLMRVLATLVAVVALASSNATSRAELLLNGGFDDTSGTFVNWTATGNVFNSTQFSNEGTTSGGLAAVFNAGDTTANGVVSQTFNTVAGTTYGLTFDYGSFAGNNPQSIEATVTDPTSLDTLGDLTVTTMGTGNSPAVFTSYYVIFTAESSSATLTFSDRTVNPSGSDGVLDTASVNLVPEPSSVVLCGFASLIGSAYAWRRKARATN